MEIVGEYSDEGHSGKNIKGRPEFMKMLNDIEDSEIERAYAEAKEKQQEQAKEQSQKQGNYRWTYRLNMLKTPVVRNMMIKIMFLMLSGRWRFLCAHTVDNRRRLPPPQMAERILSDSKTAIFRYNIKRIGNVIREC